MKTARTFLVLFVATLFVNAAIASGNLKVNFASNEKDLTVVEISDAKLNSYHIEVADMYGEKLYQMKTNSPAETLVKRYDFSDLDNGIYWYSVKTDKETKTSRIEVKAGKVEVLDVRKTLEPTFIMDEKKLNLSFLNFPQENVHLYVYDENYNEIVKTKLGKDFAIHKSIDFSDISFGNYEVVVANDADIFSYKVSIN